MVSWYPKQTKIVLLLSTMHHDDKIGDSGKPEIIEFYNKTKAGVDALDQKVCHYTTYCKTSRWLLAVFYDILDLQTYNAFVLYKLRPPVVPGINLTSCARLDQAKYAEQSTIPKWFECPHRPGISSSFSCNWYTKTGAGTTWTSPEETLHCLSTKQ